jgi:hypothetical protein
MSTKRQRPGVTARGVADTMATVPSGTVAHPTTVELPAATPGRYRLADAIPIRDKLLWDLNDIAALTGLSRRLLERQISAGQMPPCDLRIGRRCLWRPETVRRWIGEGGCP